MELIIESKGNKISILYDADDHQLISKYRWWVTGKHGNQYITAEYSRINGRRRYVPMHRLILGIIDSKLKCDHINHNTFDNRRENLRICNHSENMYNLTAWGFSKYKGVTYSKSRKRWVSRIRKDGKLFHLGCYHTEHDAALAYDKKALVFFGEFANLNFK